METYFNFDEIILNIKDFSHYYSLKLNSLISDLKEENIQILEVRFTNVMNIQPFTIVEAFFYLLEMDFIILGSNFYCLRSIIITEDILKFKGYEKIGYKLKV